MSHKLTPADMFADVARATAAAEANGITLNWNEPTPFNCPAGADCTGAAFPGHVAHEPARPPLTLRQKIEALDAELRRDDLDSSIRASFIIERAQLTQGS